MTKKLIVILGNKLLSPQIHSELIGRMDIGINLFKDIFADYLILSGGQSNPNVKYTESEIMKDYAIKKSVPFEKIILDTNSLDTVGNAYFVRKIVNELECNSTIYVVSSFYHMKRVKYIFSICFGNNYNLNFDYSYLHGNEEVNKKEERSMERAKKLFRNIDYGDLEKIEKKIFSEHDLYKY